VHAEQQQHTDRQTDSRQRKRKERQTWEDAAIWRARVRLRPANACVLAVRIARHGTAHWCWIYCVRSSALYTTPPARLRRSAASVAVAWRKINLLGLARSTSKVVGGWRNRGDDTIYRKTSINLWTTWYSLCLPATRTRLSSSVHVVSSCRHGLCRSVKLLPVTPVHTISMKFLNCDELWEARLVIVILTALRPVIVNNHSAC